MASPSTRRAPLVLIVEDGDAEYESLAEYLAERGFDTVGVADVIEVLDRADALGPDLLLLDLCPPDSGGLDAVRLLRFHDATCRLPVVAVAPALGDGGVTDDEARAAGCDGVLRRPFELPALLTAVRRILDGSGLGERHI